MAIDPSPAHDPFTGAVALFELGRLDRAEPELRRVLAAEPEHGLAHGYLALCLLQRSALQEGLKESVEATRLRPDIASMWLVRSEALRLLRQLDDALAAADEALDCDPANPDGFLARARVHIDQLRAKEALVDVREALALAPDDEEAHRLEAAILTDLGRPHEAAAAAERALRLDPGSAQAHTVLGWQRLHAGERAEALAAFQEALRLEPSNGSARTGLLQSMSAGNRAYAIVQRWLLWNRRMVATRRVIALMPCVVVAQVLARNEPATRAFLVPVLVLGVLWVMGLALARPLSNAVLASSEEGRRFLARDEMIEARLVLAAIGMAVPCALGWPATGDPAWVAAAVSMLSLSIFVPLVYRETGRGRSVRLALGAAAVVALVLGLVLSTFGSVPRNGDGVPKGNAGMLLVAPIFLTLALPLLDPDLRRARARLPRRRSASR